eukprot:647823-Pelagomonas_calceolata.AAC.2
MSEGQPVQTQRKRPSHAHAQGGHPGTPPLGGSTGPAAFLRQGSLREKGSTGPPAFARQASLIEKGSTGLPPYARQASLQESLASTIGAGGRPPGTPTLRGLGEFGGEGVGCGGVHPLERPELPLHIKAALFGQLLAEAEEQGKKVCVYVDFLPCRQTSRWC